MTSPKPRSVSERSLYELMTGNPDELAALLAELGRFDFAADALAETEQVFDDMRRLHEQMGRLTSRLSRVQGVWVSLQEDDASLRNSLQVWRLLNRHKIVQRGESAHCTHCDRHFGWFCPHSPDGTCYYFTDGGKIHLLSGEKVDPAAGHDAQFESTDTCLFCGHPEERK